MKLTDVLPGQDYLLIFYGIEPRPSAGKIFFDLMVNCFNKLGYPPNKLSADGSGQSERIISFNRGKLNLQKAEFRELSALCISSLAEGGTYTNSDHVIEAKFDSKNHRKLVFSASEKIESLSLFSLLPIANDLIQDFQPTYGICYKYYRPKQMTLDTRQASNTEGEERTRLYRWDDYAIEHDLYNQGLIRGVYPFNFLNSSQLQMPVEGVSLSDWIQQDLQRGTLEPIDERLTLWRVPEEAIPAIRDILWKTGQIFDWNKYCPPPLSPEEAEEFIRRSQACIEAEIAAELGTAPKPGMGYQVLYDAEGREVKVYGPPPQD